MQDALQSWAIGLVRALDLQELRLEKQKHTSTLFKKRGVLMCSKSKTRDCIKDGFT